MRELNLDAGLAPQAIINSWLEIVWHFVIKAIDMPD